MSSLKDKLYNYEVIPPSAVWEQISVELTESEIERSFPKKIYGSEAEPPANAWERIAVSLQGRELPARLYDAEVTPPDGAWEKINAALSPVSETITQRPLRRITPYARYAAAAVIIGLLAFFALRFVINSGGSHEIQSSNRQPDSSASSNNQAAALLPQLPTENSIRDEDEELLERSKKMVAKLDRSTRRISHAVNRYANTTQFSYADFSDRELSQSIYAYEDHVPSIAERYVMLMTPDGNIIRMSKKLSDLLCCVSGEEQDAQCVDQLKKWREKMANSTLAPSPANFMDILNMVSSLDEEAEL